ncbi:MAG: YfhO family protein [Oscillospiraceae bacterium]|nr:YfhO family protein [Oscillospiraceae bacterium]
MIPIIFKATSFKELRLYSKEPNYCRWAFFLTFFGVGLAVLVRALILETGSTINDFSMLFSDAYHQYFPFFKNYREALLSGDSLLYNWSIGMGIDYLGLISYYLGSPLNLLSILVPESLLVDYFTLLNVVRLSLASMFFALMLKKLFGKNDPSIVVFGSFYATCAWAFGYMWNSMWVDTFALLPLVVLGTVSLLEKRKFVLYTVSLFLSVFINYYIGFFTCIFTLLVFICYEICRWKSFRKFCIDLGLMAVFTVLAIGMTAVLSLPTLAALQTTSSSTNEFPTEFKLNIPDRTAISQIRTDVTDWMATVFPNADPNSESYSKWSDFLTNAVSLLTGMKQVATNNFSSMKPNYSATEGLPNIYCGIFTNVFLFLFLTTRQIKRRERICGLGLLIFINISFLLRQLDYIWHGFHFTNMIPYRFSFLYSFVMLFVAYRVWLQRKRLRLWQVVIAVGLTVLMFFASDQYAAVCENLADAAFQEAWSAFLAGPSSESLKALTDQFEVSNLYPVTNLLFLTMYTLVLGYFSFRRPMKKTASWEQRREAYKHTCARRRVAGICLLGVLFVELAFNFVYFGITFSETNLSHYPRGKEDSETIFGIMQELEDDTLFYRAETTHTQTYNDGALNGYHGITTFTSSANVAVTKYMQNLGYAAAPTWNRYAFEEGSPVTNLFLDLKYMVERKGEMKENPYFTDIHRSGNVHLLKNNYYLPLGFMTDPALAELPFVVNTNHFQFQNELLSAAVGSQVTPWKLVSGADLSIDSTDSVTLNSTSTDGVGVCSYSAGGSGSVFYTYTFREEGFFCVYYNMPKRNDITVSYDDGSGYRTLYTESYAIPFMMSVCQVKPGDRVQLTLKCDANESSTMKLWGGLLDQAVLERAYDDLSRGTMELTRFENTLVEGTVNCVRDGLLYTSIPQNNDNWQVWVDGQPAEITLIGEAMCGVRLTEGSHTVTFRYHNDSFVVGAIVSAACAAAFGLICWFVYVYLKKNPGKCLPIRRWAYPEVVEQESPEAILETIRLRGVHPTKKKKKKK